MVFKGFIAAVTAVALSATPVAASASSAAAASRATQVVPADETVEGSELRGGWFIPLAALIAVLLGLCFAGVICDKGDNPPNSP